MHCFTTSLTNKRPICEVIVDEARDGQFLEEQKKLHDQGKYNHFSKMDDVLASRGKELLKKLTPPSQEKFADKNLILKENSSPIDEKVRQELLRKHSYTALIDTGSNVTCINKNVIKNLNLKIKAEKKIWGTTGEKMTNIYYIGIGIPLFITDKKNPKVLKYELQMYAKMEAPQFHVVNENFDVIIGMDIIMQCSLYITQNDYTFCI